MKNKKCDTGLMFKHKTALIIVLVAMTVAAFSIFGLLKETDNTVVNYFFDNRNTSVLKIFYFITLFASSGTALITVLSVAVSSLIEKTADTAIAAVAGFSVTELAVLSLKEVFHRSRPGVALRAISENSFSFPSGHAATAAFIFGFLAYLIFIGTKNTTTRVVVILSAILMTIAVDLSRVYLGVHYASDVIAGNMLGTAALFITIVLHRKYTDNRAIQFKPNSYCHIAFTAFATCVLTAALWYLFGSSPWVLTVRQ